MNKVILITGTTSGIGLNLIKRLSLNNKIICVNRSETLDESLKLNNNLSFYKIDITNYNEVKKFTENLLLKIVPDIYIFNAGINKYDNKEFFDISIYRDVFDINLYGVLNFVSVLEKNKVKQKKIIFMSSVSNLIPNPASLGYYSSKLLLKNLAKQLNKNKTNVYKTAILSPIKTQISRDLDAPKRLAGKIYDLLAVEKEEMLPSFEKFINNNKKVYYFTKVSYLFYLTLKIVLFFFPNVYQGGKENNIKNNN